MLRSLATIQDYDLSADLGQERFSQEGALEVVKRFYKRAKIVIDDKSEDLANYICKTLKWCKLKEAMGERAALDLVYEKIQGWLGQGALFIAGLLIDATTFGTLSALSLSAAALDQICGCGSPGENELPEG